MEMKRTLDLASVFSMRGGDDEASYASQSHPANYTFHKYLKPHLSQIMDNSSSFLRSIEHVCVADFGCSHGRNTLDCADFIVGKLRSMGNCKNIHYFFCDLPSNDFNSLFRLMEKRGQLHKRDQSYSPAGVPGSFHGLLFPEDSLHFGISTISLHWLSQVPPQVLQRDSPAWNGGHIWIHGERPATARAYAEQFHKDARDFLKCRAKECVRGALLYLVMLGRAESHPAAGTYMRASSNPWGYEFESTWEEMVSEGLLPAEMRDTFNMPVYLPSVSEFEEVVAAVPEFHAQELKVLDGVTVSTLPVEKEETINRESYMFWGVYVRCLTEPLVAAHIGMELADEFFKRHERKARETRRGQCEFEWDCVCAVLVRK